MGRPRTHSRKDVRRAAALAVLRIIQVKGFRGVTAREVAAVSGYPVGVLYKHFKGGGLDSMIQLAVQTGGPVRPELFRAYAWFVGKQDEEYLLGYRVRSS